MAGPYRVTLQGANGKAIHGFIPASAAVGAYLPVDKQHLPTAASPDSVKFSQGFYVTDAIFTVPTGSTGVLELICNGETTGILIDASSNIAGAAGRQKFSIPIVANADYRFRVAEGFPA